MTSKVKNHLSYRFMPMIILSYLLINLYLIMIGSDWCQSEGCEVSKNLLQIEQTDLYYVAIAAFFVLLLVGLNILKKDSHNLKMFYKFSIFTIMMCETILLSYLYFKSGTLCITCFIFYALVIVNYLLLDIKTHHIYIIPFIVISFGILDLNLNDQSNASLSSKYTLLQSEKCEHCKKIKEYLQEHTIVYKKEDYSDYSGLFSSLNITKIPVLIVKNNENSLLILNGVSEITNYLNTNVKKIPAPVILQSVSSNNDFLLKSVDEGCEVDILKKELESCN